MRSFLDSGALEPEVYCRRRRGRARLSAKRRRSAASTA